MQLSLVKLQALKEPDLRRKVLLPLFRAMSFHDVTELHGSSELGKDIVMWQEDSIRGRTNFAVVVKAKKIAGGPTSLAVCKQVRECFGSTYPDPITLEERTVDRVIVVTSGLITPPASKSIGAEIKASRLEGKVDLLDGTALFEKIRRFLPGAMLWYPLQEAGNALNEASDNYDFSVFVGPDGVSSVFVSPRHAESQQREPIKGSLGLRFPATPEGMQKRAEYKRFLETGTQVHLTAENIAALEIPEFIKSLASEGEITTVTLGPSLLSEPLLRTLLVLDASGRPAFSFDYIHITHQQGGTREVTLDNRAQPIPFRFSLTFTRATGEAHMNISFEPASANAWQYLKWLRFQRAAATGTALVLIDWTTGLAQASMDTSSLSFNTPSGVELDFASRLAFIQSRSNVIFSLRKEEPYFNADDMANVQLASEIIASGRAALPNLEISFTPSDTEQPTPTADDQMEICVRQQDFALEILGCTLSLGEAQILCKGAVKLADHSSGPTPRFKIEATDEAPFLATFPKWLTSTPAAEENAAPSSANAPD